MTLDNYKKSLLSSREFAQHDGTDMLFRLSASDPNRSYKINKYGFRGDEFAEDAKILAAGCSFTFGVGVDESHVWPSVLSSKLEIGKVNSIAMPGASISWIVESVFKYFKNYGHPEYLLCLFPDFERHSMPIDNSFYVDKDYKVHGASSHEDGTINNNGQFFKTLALSEDSLASGIRYIKLPYDFNKVLSKDFCIKESTLAIRYLEDYCRAAGIKFLWSFWDRSATEMLIELNQNSEVDRLLGFFDIYDYVPYYTKVLEGARKDVFFSDSQKRNSCISEHLKRICDCPADCHIEESLGSLDFDIGTDTALRIDSAHPGAHWHIHCAEGFISELKGRGWI